VHAIIATRGVPDDPQAFVNELRDALRGNLSSVKVPKSYELVEALDRNEAGKVRRAQLAAARAETPPDVVYVPDAERSSRVD
jgi:acyl-CoA synthetase (AMP-forming)/AMP-acid ligase II